MLLWELGLLAVAITLIPVAQLMSSCVLGMAFFGFPQDRRSKFWRELAAVQTGRLC